MIRQALFAAAGALLLVPSGYLAGEETLAPQRDVSISLTPAAGRLQTIAGEVRAPGRPVVLVRADVAGEPWWVQRPASVAGENRFEVKAIFGSERSLPGSRYEVIAILVADGTSRLETGQTLAKLPELPRSNKLTVMLGENGALQVDSDAGDDNRARLAEILQPKSETDVVRVTTIEGRIEQPRIPVVVVRPMNDGSLWWVQRAPTIDEHGRFNLKVVFGSERTPQGTRFRMVVLAMDSEEQAAAMKPGDSMKDLPEGIEMSREVVVTLRSVDERQANSDASAAQTQQ